MAYKKVVEMLGENLASFLELAKKWLVDWSVDTKKLLHFFHNIKKEDLIGLLDGTHAVQKLPLPVSGSKKSNKLKLEAQGIEIPELTEEFDPKNYFTENQKVKYYFGDNFQKHVLNPAQKVSNLTAMSFDKHKFTETIYGKEIMEHFQISESVGLMTREEILRVIAYLTSLQPKGESGTLQTNGYSTIIGYMMCHDGVVRAVRVDWYSGTSMWRCYCNDLGDWNAGHELLSRN